MKRILIALALLLAPVVGFVMPELWLGLQDKTLETVEIIDLSEPVLEWASDKSAEDIWESEISGEEIAYRLLLFGLGPEISIPQTMDSSDSGSWASEHAIRFLTNLFEVEPYISDVFTEYRYAWFENGIIIPIWSVEITFNDRWLCAIDIDEESGVIMRCMIQSNSLSFAPLFPNCFESSGYDEFGSQFMEQVATRFCETLQQAMCYYDGISVSTRPTVDYNGVNITIAGAEATSVTIPLRFYPTESIWFNYRS